MPQVPATDVSVGDVLLSPRPGVRRGVVTAVAASWYGVTVSYEADGLRYGTVILREEQVDVERPESVATPSAHSPG